MTRLLLVGLLLLAAGLPVRACDVCGCGAGSYSFGFMPQFHRHFAGVRYRQQAYSSRLGGGYASREWFRSVEVWGRYYPRPRWQVLAFVPLQFNRHESGGEVRTLQGPGDAVLAASYNLLNTLPDTASMVKHSLWVGGGVKLPAGRYRFTPADAAQVANPAFQLGTGSVDWLLTAQHTARWGAWGLNTDLACKLNGQNADGYHFGNRLTGATSVFRVLRAGRLGLMPYGGVQAEYARHDLRRRYRVGHTGGGAVFGTGGVDVFGKRMAAGLGVQVPVGQDIAGGAIRAGRRLSGHVVWLF